MNRDADYCPPTTRLGERGGSGTPVTPDTENATEGRGAEPTAAEIEAAARAALEYDGLVLWDDEPESVRELDREQATAALAAALPLVVARLREQIEHGAVVAAERHTADTERGGCSCGFCVWPVEHAVRMAIREAD